MNNRKPKNRRGKITRKSFVQVIVEKPTIMHKGKEIENPAYPGETRIIHHQVPPAQPVRHEGEKKEIVVPRPKGVRFFPQYGTWAINEKNAIRKSKKQVA